MPLLIVIGIIIVIKLIEFFDWLNTNVQPFAPLEMEAMRKEMSGKSEVQCKRVLNRYSQGKRRWQNWF